jgi:hypothetical protein
MQLEAPSNLTPNPFLKGKGNQKIRRRFFENYFVGTTVSMTRNFDWAWAEANLRRATG